MEIKQFEDKNLAHYSYAILSGDKIALVDPSRNPQPYYDFANANNAKIVAVIETHPHADFVSSHKEISETTGANIYVSKLVGADYIHTSFDDGDTISLGNISLKAMNTPGHSPDSISIVATDSNGKDHAVFTGDTLFIGDCGRPDLREEAGAIMAARKDLAENMYDSLRDKLMKLEDDVLVYPAHGAGSLCGKGLSEKNVSTMGEERATNWSLQDSSKEDFVENLLSDQPFIPRYFLHDVGINKAGADAYKTSINQVPLNTSSNFQDSSNILNPSLRIIDTRPEADFKKAHIKNAINIMAENSFETWLGSIINPNEKFYLVAESQAALAEVIQRTAKIGYESQIELAFVSHSGNESQELFDYKQLMQNETDFTLVDIRNHSELKEGKIFDQAIHIPLYELSERAMELPTTKPIVVHCAGGYRSAAGASIIKSKLNSVEVYDLSENVKKFQDEKAISL